jgi:AraC family transcriptional regulator
MRDFEFVWLIEGDAVYRYDDREVAAPQGSIVLCQPGWTDAFAWDRQRRTRHGYYHFSISATPADWPARSEWPVVRALKDEDVIPPLLRHLLTWHGQGSPVLRELAMKAVLTAFVTGEVATADVPPEALPDPVEAAWNHLHRRLEEDPSARIDLAELSEAACVTGEHLCRLFKKATGRTPVQTVLLARLDRAAVLLARSNFSIAEIAQMCGFSSQFHFSRRFKDAFGHSPLQMRQAIRNGDTPPTPRLLRVYSRRGAVKGDVAR